MTHRTLMTRGTSPHPAGLFQRRKKIVVGIVGILVALSLLVACAAPTDPAVEQPETPIETPGPLPTDTSATPTEVESDRYGGILVVASGAEPPHLNPLNNLYTTAMISAQLFPALLEYDFEMNPKPWLAKDWEISDDGLIYTFQLDENAVWTDGNPITSQDVKISFEEMIIPHHPSGEVNFSAIEEIQAPDNTTVIFRLREPFAPIMSTLGHMMAPILPASVYAGTEIMDNPHNLNPTVSGGPMVFVEWVQGSHITVERNENYWFKEELNLPYLDRVVFRFMPDATSRAVALETGEVDYVAPGFFPDSELPRISNLDDIIVDGDQGYEAILSVVTFGFNLRKEPFDNINVRRALSHAVDKDFIVEAVTLGFHGKSTGPIHQNSWAYSPDVPDYSYDPDLARSLLDEAGYPPDANGVRFSTSITFIPGQSQWAKAAEIMVDNYRDIGVEVELVSLEDAAYYSTVYEAWDFDIAPVSWLSGPDPHQIAAIYHTDNIQQRIFTNHMGYSNSDVDALFDEAVMTTDQAERRRLYAEIQQKIVEDAPAVWLIDRVQHSVYKSSIQNLPPGPWMGTRDPVHEIWIQD